MFPTVGGQEAKNISTDEINTGPFFTVIISVSDKATASMLGHQLHQKYGKVTFRWRRTEKEEGAGFSEHHKESPT